MAQPTPRPTAGDLVRVKNTDTAHTGFQDPTGALADPGTVTLIYKDPTGATTTKVYPTGIVRDSLGVYHYDIDTTGLAGTWTVEWKATGAVQCISYMKFDVLPAPF